VRDLGVKNEVSGDMRDDVIIDVINEEVMIDSRKSNDEEEMKEKRKDAMAPMQCWESCGDEMLELNEGKIRF
jgi:hypothetical protein